MTGMPEHAHRAAERRQPRDRRVDHDPATGVNAGPPSDRDGADDAPDEAKGVSSPAPVAVSESPKGGLAERTTSLDSYGLHAGGRAGLEVPEAQAQTTVPAPPHFPETWCCKTCAAEGWRCAASCGRPCCANGTEGVGTGAGGGATRQDTGAAWVNRSEDCPEAPAQAHPLTPADPHPHAWADLGKPGLHGSVCRLCGETQID